MSKLRKPPLHPDFIALFADSNELTRFLRSIKKMPQERNVQSDSVPENYGLFLKAGNWNLLYYVREEGKTISRMRSLGTDDIYLCRAMRDSVMDHCGMRDTAYVESGMRGAKWALENPNSLHGVRIRVYIKGPERHRKFDSSGDLTAVEKALKWRTDAATAYVERNKPKE